MKYRNEDKHCTGDKIQSTYTIKLEIYCNYSITNIADIFGNNDGD